MQSCMTRSAMAPEATTNPSSRAAVSVNAKVLRGSGEQPKQRTAIDESDPLAAIHEIASDMHAARGISKRTMREYDELCIPPVPEYTKTAIIKIRKSVRVSQGVLAAYLNTSPSTVQKWEAGTKKPSGAAAKLLQVIEKHGLEVLA